MRLMDTDRDNGLFGDLGSTGTSSLSARTVRPFVADILEVDFDLVNDGEGSCTANVALLSATDFRVPGTMTPGCAGSPTLIPPGGDKLGLRLKGALSTEGLMAIAVTGLSDTGDTTTS